MNNDTNIGGASDKFPLTRISAIEAVKHGDAPSRARAFELLIAVYWKPVYKYIRIKWNRSNEDAKDLTQGFFEKVHEKDFFDSYDSTKARFRTFLRVCLDGYVQNEMKSEGRLKRGGDVQKLSLDFTQADTELAGMSAADIRFPDTLDRYFESEWTKSLLELSINALKEHLEKKGKSTHFQLFEQYDLESRENEGDISYDKLAKQFDIPVTDVTNYLSYARKEFRKIVLINVRELTATDEEFRQEVFQLLGISSG
jgi:RNA polymerase sigma factor (sigma-70 family)